MRNNRGIKKQLIKEKTKNMTTLLLILGILAIIPFAVLGLIIIGWIIFWILYGIIAIIAGIINMLYDKYL